MRLIGTTKELAICAGFGALIVVVQLLAGSVIYTVTQVPAAATLISSFILAYIAIIPLLLIRKTDAALATLLTMSVISAPLSVFGPPGLPKIIQFIPVIAAIELILIISNWKKAGYIIAIPAASAIALPMHYYFLALIGFPGAELLRKYLLLFMAIVMMESLLGAWLGLITYEKKLKNLKVVKQLQ